MCFTTSVGGVLCTKFSSLFTNMIFFKLFVKLYSTIFLFFILITTESGNSIIFDRGNIDSSVNISSTKSVLLGIIFRLYLFNNAHTRSIGMFLVLLNNFDETKKSGKCANRFYDYRYFCLKYCNIYFAISGILYKCTKYGQLRYRMFYYLFNAYNFKKVLSSFLGSFATCFKFRVRVEVTFFCSMNFSSGIIICQNINLININTVSQSQYPTVPVLQHRTVCTGINFNTVYQYRTVCTGSSHSTVSQYRTVFTTVHDIINVHVYINNFHVNVNRHPTSTEINVNNHVNINCDHTATTIDHALYFNKCFFVTTSFGDNSTTTTILFSFSRFFTKFIIFLPRSNNNNVSNNGVTRVLVDNFTRYNNNGNIATTTTTTYHSLVKPMLGLGGVPQFSSVPTLFSNVSATFWCSILGGVMMVFIPVITYFRWPILGGVSVVFIPDFIHFRIHFRIAIFRRVKFDLHPFNDKSSPYVYIPFSSYKTKGIGGGITGRFRFLLHLKITIPVGTIMVGILSFINTRAVPIINTRTVLSINTRTVTNINSIFESRFPQGYNSNIDTSTVSGVDANIVALTFYLRCNKNFYPLQCKLVQIILVYFRVGLRTSYTRLLKDQFNMTNDYDQYHHRCYRWVTNINISDGPSFDSSPFMIHCPINVPSFDPIHYPSNYPSISRGSSLCPNYLNVVHKISLDELDARGILTTSPIPTVSILTIDHDKTIELLDINLNKSPTQASSLTSNFVEEQQLLQEPSRVSSSQPRHCTDDLSSHIIDINSSAPSPEPRHHLLKLQLDSLFSMTVDYHLHHHRRCRSDTNVKTNDGPFIDPSFDSSTFIIISPIDISSFDTRHDPNNYPSSDCSSFISRGSSLHLFASNSELNLHSDDVSRIDSSTNPGFDPSPSLIKCPTDNPSRDPSLHTFDSNSESFIKSNYVSRIYSNAKQGIFPKSVKLLCNNLDHYPSQPVPSSCIPSASTRAYSIFDPSVYPNFDPTCVSCSNSRFIHEYIELLPSLHSCLFTSNNPDHLNVLGYDSLHGSISLLFQQATSSIDLFPRRMTHSTLILLSSMDLLDLLTSFSSKPFTSVHSLRGGTRRFSSHYDSKVDFLQEIITIFIIDMGCQQTILQLNESSFQSQSFIKVNAGSRHNLLSSDMSSMEAHTSNMPFLDVPATSSSLKVTKANIQDPFSNGTISDPSIDPIIVTRMIPSYVTVLEIRQDTQFSNSIGNFTNGKFFLVLNKPKTILNLNSNVNQHADIQRDPIILSTVGPRVVPDTEPINWLLRICINDISLNDANANILDQSSDPGIYPSNIPSINPSTITNKNPSFVTATNYDPSINSNLISRLIPMFVLQCVPNTIPSKLPFSTKVPVPVNTVVVLSSITNIKSNFVSSILPGSYSSIDATNNPSLDSSEILSFDTSYHQETITIPSVDYNSIPRLNPRYRPSSFLFILSSFHDVFNSSHSPSIVHFELLMFAKSSSSPVSSFNGIPFSSHNHKGIGGGIRRFKFRFRFQHFQFRLLFFKIDPGNSFNSSIDTSDFSATNIDPDCIQEPSDVPTKEPIRVPTEITYFLQAICTSYQHINPIDGNYFYYVAIMDFTQGNNNNGESGAESYDVGDISDVRINKSFLQEGSSNSVIVHAEDFKPYHHEYIFYADIFPMKRNDLVTHTIDKVFFDIYRMILVSLHTSLYSSLHTTQVLYAPHQVISPNIVFLWPTSLLLTKFSSSSVSSRYGIPFSYHNPKATGGGTGQIRFQLRLQFDV